VSPDWAILTFVGTVQVLGLKGAAVRVRRSTKVFLYLYIAGVFALGACGGSDSGSSDASTSDTAATSDTTATADTTGESIDPEAQLATFCSSADEQAGSNLAETDDATVIADKLGQNADTLAKLAESAPDDVKEAVEATATAAREMADAVAADPSLDNINEVVTKYATPDFEASSKKVEEFIKANCGE